MPLRFLIGAGLVLAAYVLVLGTARASHVVCGARADMVAKLAAAYGEVQVGHGVTAKGKLTEMFVGPKGRGLIYLTPPQIVPIFC
jgi:hypothetical protein